MTRVAIVGGGIIGLSCAWQLLRSGFDVTVVDPEPGHGATRAAGGMITPASEAEFGQETLFTASQASHALWGAFAAALGEDTGQPIELTTSGTLLIAADADDAVVLSRHARLLERHKEPVEWLTTRAVRRLEPALGPRLAGALGLRDETSVEPRRVVRALTSAVSRRGATMLDASGEPWVVDGAVAGVLARGADGRAEPLPADLVLVAAGWQTPRLLHVVGLQVPIRPLKGQVLRLRTAPGTLTRTIRAVVHGRSVYLVPRADGELVVGATSEDVGPDPTVTAGAVHDLLHDAIEVVPELAEAEFAESLARFRPATPDNLPFVGVTGVPGLLLAAGHGRDGVLLAPLTAAVITAQARGEPVPREAECFAPSRKLGPKEPE